MIIKITQDDINNGTPKSPCSCPIALALMRTFPKSKSILVDSDTITLDGVTVFTPREAEDFIWAFDDNEKLEPFEFELEINYHD